MVNAWWDVMVLSLKTWGGGASTKFLGVLVALGFQQMFKGIYASVSKSQRSIFSGASFCRHVLLLKV